jgi:putative ABC transport system substrate-binding protein
MQVELAAKQLGLMHELLPRATRFAALVNPNNPAVVRSTATELEEAASSIGAQIKLLQVSSYAEVNDVFANISRETSEALLVSSPVNYSAIVSDWQPWQRGAPYQQCITIAGLPKSVV